MSVTQRRESGLIKEIWCG